jgi:hypothetical protein
MIERSIYRDANGNMVMRDTAPQDGRGMPLPSGRSERPLIVTGPGGQYTEVLTPARVRQADWLGSAAVITVAVVAGAMAIGLLLGRMGGCEAIEPEHPRAADPAMTVWAGDATAEGSETE